MDVFEYSPGCNLFAFGALLTLCSVVNRTVTHGCCPVSFLFLGSVQTAVINVFKGGGLQNNELYTLNENIR